MDRTASVLHLINVTDCWRLKSLQAVSKTQIARPCLLKLLQGACLLLKNKPASRSPQLRQVYFRENYFQCFTSGTDSSLN
jgi:hypothetical protein